MRVISGTAGGLPLKSPKGVDLRPTQDRIRQVIFSALAEKIPGARVLDLYAGTGGLAIEALSRGAASAVLVEQNAKCVACIEENLERCRLRGDVRKQDAMAYLRAQGTTSSKFDLIFADPPYRKVREILDQDEILPLVAALLAEDGLFIWEHYSGQKIRSPVGWTVVRDRDYGETGLTFLRREVISGTLAPAEGT